MIVTAALTAFVVWSMFVGTIAAPWPLVIGLVLGGILYLFGRHNHRTEWIVIDVISRKSRLLKVNTDLKVWCCIALLFLCILSRTPWPALLLFVVMTFLTVAGGVRLRDYLSLLSLPAVFLLLSAIALLWFYSGNDSMDAVVKTPFFSGYLMLTKATQATSKLVISRALGAVSCLYFMSLSTPVPDIISALRRVKVPSVVTDIAVLIYRYIFIMLSTYHNMKDSAASRLGYCSFKRSLRTTGLIYGNLLLRSFRRAGTCFDAMESRCYDGDIRFLEHRKKARPLHLLVAGLLIAGMVIAVYITW